MDAMGDESCSRCQQFSSGLVEVIDVMGRWHWLRGRNEKNGGRREWVDQYVQKKGLNSDTKQLTFNAVLTKGCHHGAGFLLGDDTSLKTTDHFVAICVQCYLPCACAQCTHGAEEFPQAFAKRSIVSVHKRSRSEASFLGSPAEMIAQCKANEAEKTVKGLIDFAAYQSHTIPWDWYIHLHESLISYIIPGLFLI